MAEADLEATKLQEALGRLVDIFPSTPLDELADAFVNCNHDYATTVALILSSQAEAAAEAPGPEAAELPGSGLGSGAELGTSSLVAAEVDGPASLHVGGRVQGQPIEYQGSLQNIRAVSDSRSGSLDGGSVNALSRHGYSDRGLWNQSVLNQCTQFSSKSSLSPIDHPISNVGDRHSDIPRPGEAAFPGAAVGAAVSVHDGQRERDKGESEEDGMERGVQELMDMLGAAGPGIEKVRSVMLQYAGNVEESLNHLLALACVDTSVDTTNAALKQAGLASMEQFPPPSLAASTPNSSRQKQPHHDRPPAPSPAKTKSGLQGAPRGKKPKDRQVADVGASNPPDLSCLQEMFPETPLSVITNLYRENGSDVGATALALSGSEGAGGDDESAVQQGANGKGKAKGKGKGKAKEKANHQGKVEAKAYLDTDGTNPADDDYNTEQGSSWDWVRSVGAAAGTGGVTGGSVLSADAPPFTMGNASGPALGGPAAPSSSSVPPPPKPAGAMTKEGEDMGAFAGGGTDWEAEQATSAEGPASTLLEMFPTYDRTVLEQLLLCCDGDVRAVYNMLEDSSSDGGEAEENVVETEPPPRASTGTGPRARGRIEEEQEDVQDWFGKAPQPFPGSAGSSRVSALAGASRGGARGGSTAVAQAGSGPGTGWPDDLAYLLPRSAPGSVAGSVKGPWMPPHQPPQSGPNWPALGVQQQRRAQSHQSHSAGGWVGGFGEEEAEGSEPLTAEEQERRQVAEMEFWRDALVQTNCDVERAEAERAAARKPRGPQRQLQQLDELISEGRHSPVRDKGGRAGNRNRAQSLSSKWELEKQQELRSLQAQQLGGLLPPAPPPQVLPGGARGGVTDGLYRAHRQEALSLLEQRNALHQKANAAFRAHDPNLGMTYRARATALDAQAKEANRRAGDKIFETTNRTQRPLELDFHGLHVDEALKKLEAALPALKASIITSIKVITGRGSHSEGGQARLKPAVLALLRREGITWKEESAGGCIHIRQ